jgi:hypothetical protein
MDGSPDLVRAIDAFLAYPRRLADVSGRAQGASTGPWTVHISGRIGSFLLENQADDSCDLTVDYPVLRRGTYRVRDEVEDELGHSWPAITTAQEWIDTGVPSLAQALAALDNLAVDKPAADVTASDRTDVPGWATESSGAAALAGGGEIAFSAVAKALRDVGESQGSYVTTVAALNDQVSEEHFDRATELRRALPDRPDAVEDANTQLSMIRSLLATTQTVLTACAYSLVLETATAATAAETLACAARATARDLTWLTAVAEQGSDPTALYQRFGLAETASIWRSVADHVQATRDERGIRSPLRPASLRARANARRY